MARIIFITGTDTGVGKTVLTALLTRFLRRAGVRALAMKPFCSGSRADARLLREMQEKVLTLDEVNPFYFARPVAPSAALGRGKDIRLDTVLAKIHALEKRCDTLLIEGSGGLMVPLGKNYRVLDLIVRLNCQVLVAGRNRLGTINHTLLTLNALEAFGVKNVNVVWMEEKKPDFSARTNVKMVQKMAPKVPIFSLPNLGIGASRGAIIKINAKKMKKTLARIFEDDSFVPVRRVDRTKNLINKTR